MVYPRWWLNQQSEKAVEGLSVLDLINAGTLDCKLASLLWILMEHRTSVLVASGPAWAGKTTLLNSILDFLPPEIQQISLQGYFEDFRFLNYCKPEKSRPPESRQIICPVFICLCFLLDKLQIVQSTCEHVDKILFQKIQVFNIIVICSDVLR